MQRFSRRPDAMKNPESALCQLILSKILEEVSLTERLLSRGPEGSLNWRPRGSAGDIDSFEMSRLLAHLTECLAGFCAVLYAARPNELNQFLSLRTEKPPRTLAAGEARARILAYREHLEKGFQVLTDADLARLVPTVFVPRGEAILTLLLGNLEHLLNHKSQLFFYLKLLGIPVSTQDLYCLRGRGEAPASGA